jgi:hypothetical protein
MPKSSKGKPALKKTNPEKAGRSKFARQLHQTESAHVLRTESEFAKSTSFTKKKAVADRIFLTGVCQSRAAFTASGC